MKLADDYKITISFLNPVLLSVKYKSFACLKYLVENYDLRQSLREIELVFKHETLGESPIKSLILLILLKIKDNEALSFLTR